MSPSYKTLFVCASMTPIISMLIPGCLAASQQLAVTRWDNNTTKTTRYKMKLGAEEVFMYEVMTIDGVDTPGAEQTQLPVNENLKELRNRYYSTKTGVPHDKISGDPVKEAILNAFTRGDVEKKPSQASGCDLAFSGEWAIKALRGDDFEPLKGNFLARLCKYYKDNQERTNAVKTNMIAPILCLFYAPDRESDRYFQVMPRSCYENPEFWQRPSKNDAKVTREKLDAGYMMVDCKTSYNGRYVKNPRVDGKIYHLKSPQKEFNFLEAIGTCANGDVVTGEHLIFNLTGDAKVAFENIILQLHDAVEFLEVEELIDYSLLFEMRKIQCGEGPHPMISPNVFVATTTDANKQQFAIHFGAIIDYLQPNNLKKKVEHLVKKGLPFIEPAIINQIEYKNRFCAFLNEWFCIVDENQKTQMVLDHVMKVGDGETSYSWRYKPEYLGSDLGLALRHYGIHGCTRTQSGKISRRICREQRRFNQGHRSTSSGASNVTGRRIPSPIDASISERGRVQQKLGSNALGDEESSPEDLYGDLGEHSSDDMFNSPGTVERPVDVFSSSSDGNI